jgi:uncharacterized OB-fold protein
MRRCEKCGFKFSVPAKAEEQVNHRAKCSREFTTSRYLRSAQNCHSTKRKAPITLAPVNLK